MIKKFYGFSVFFLMVCIFSNISYAEVIDRIVAVINEDIITLVELNRAIHPYLIEVEKTAYSDAKKAEIIKQLQKDMLKKLIEFKLTDQEAQRLNIKVSDKELQSSIDQFLESENITEKDLKKALLKEKITYEEYKKEMREKILRPKLINRVIRAKVVITNEELQDYYKKHEKEYSGMKKYHLRNILMEDEEQIKKVKALLDKGDDFKKLAKEYSQASNAQAGGDLGTFELDGFTDNIKENILKLGKGQYTNIILTDSGFQIFFLIDIETSGGKTLDDLRDEITRKLFSVKAEKKYKEWLDEIKTRSVIKIVL